MLKHNVKALSLYIMLESNYPYELKTLAHKFMSLTL